MNKVLALILAGERGEGLSILASKRAKPAIPFTDKYRIINFTISIGKGVRLPPHIKVGKNCKTDCDVEENDFSDSFVPSGSSVSKREGYLT